MPPFGIRPVTYSVSTRNGVPDLSCTRGTIGSGRVSANWPANLGLEPTATTSRRLNPQRWKA